MSNEQHIGKEQEIKEWIENLPVANIEKSADFVYQYLNVFLNQGFTSKKLFHYLELFQPTIKYLRNELRKYYIGETVLSKKQQPQMIELAQNLEIRYATAYASTLQSKLDSSQQLESKSFHATIVHRAILHLTNALVISYEIYQQPPPKLWAKFHKLYLHAEKFQIENTTLHPDTEKNTSFSTIANAYKHALLLSTSNPYHLRPKETAKLHQALFTWSSLATINKENYENDLFILHLDKNEPPEYQKFSSSQSQRFYIRGFDTHHLVNHINDILKQHTDTKLTKNIIASMSKEILQYLVGIWSKSFERKHKRVAHQGEFNICIGLSSIHYFLSDIPSTDKNSMQSNQEEAESHHPKIKASSLSLQPITNTTDEITKSEKSLQDTLGYYDPWETLSNKNSAPTSASDLYNKTEEQHFKTYLWNIIDSSPGGYCLSTEEDIPNRLQTGEIVGLQTPNHKPSNQWIIAVIRWVERNKNETKIGVKLLSPSAISVAVQIRRETPTEYLRAISLPELINLAQPATLLLPPLDYQVGEHAYVVSENLEYEVKFTQIEFNNDCFSQTQYETLQTLRDESEENEEQSESDKNDKNIDSIWDDI